MQVKILVLLAAIMLALPVMSSEDDARKALQLINHINWVVCKITNYNSPIVLEEEYNAINVNSLYLDCIKDQETIDTIKTILDTITSQRINEGDRQLLHELFDQDMSNALYESFPSPSAIISPNLVAVTINIVQSAASSYMSYKRVQHQLQTRLKRDTWELDKDKMKFLNELNKELLEKHWMLVQRYKIKDAQRVTENDILTLINRLKDDDVKRVYEFLILSERTYKKFPAYWYYRGIYGIKNNDKNAALQAFNRYQEEHLQFLRHDKIAASVAMNKVTLLIERKFKDTEIKKQLEIIEENAAKADWNLLYFCGLIYQHRLNNNADAERVLRIAVNNLEYEQNVQLKTYRDLFGSKEKMSVLQQPPPTSDGLMLCRLALMQVLGKEAKKTDILKEFQALCEKDTTANLEVLFYVDLMKLDDIFENIKTDIRSIYIDHTSKWMRTDTFTVVMPMKWFLLDNISPTLKLYSGDELMDTVTEDSDARAISKDMRVEVAFKYEGDWLIDKKITKIELEIPHKYCAVTVRFDTTDIANKKDNKWLLSYNRLLAKDAKFNGKIYDIAPLSKTDADKRNEKLWNHADTALSLLLIGKGLGF